MGLRVTLVENDCAPERGFCSGPIPFKPEVNPPQRSLSLGKVWIGAYRPLRRLKRLPAYLRRWEVAVDGTRGEGVGDSRPCERGVAAQTQTANATIAAEKSVPSSKGRLREARESRSTDRYGMP